MIEIKDPVVNGDLCPAVENVVVVLVDAGQRPTRGRSFCRSSRDPEAGCSGIWIVPMLGASLAFWGAVSWGLIGLLF